LTASPNRLTEVQPLIPIFTSVKSLVFPLFFKSFEQKQDIQILDTGTVCGDNINYFARHVKKLNICDMFFHLDQGRRKGLPFKQVLNHMVYPSQSFDGILLWDLVDRLDDSEVIEVVELCHTLMKPGGFVVLFANGEKSEHSFGSAFVIKENLTFRLIPQAHFELPLKIRTNRELINILKPFKPVKIFLHHNGFREWLIKR